MARIAQASERWRSSASFKDCADKRFTGVVRVAAFETVYTKNVIFSKSGNYFAALFCIYIIGLAALFRSRQAQPGASSWTNADAPKQYLVRRAGWH